MASVPNQSGPRHSSGSSHEDSHGKDGLGGLVGGGPSKVGIDASMRARDVARPTAEDLAAAERDLVIRHAATHVDTRPLPTGITPARPKPQRHDKPRNAPAPPVPRPPKGKDPDQPPETSGNEPVRS